jgi:AraC-like DNA-binding protein
MAGGLHEGRVKFMSDAAREEYVTASGSSLSTAPLSVESALRYFDSPGVGPENAMRLALVASLVETLALAPPAYPCGSEVPGLSNRRLMRVLAYIDANIGEPITLANLAATAGLSRMYFARQFRATTGIRPHEYVLRRRIERAQQVLTATSDTLVDIALSVGFQTQAHFTTVFKKIVGNTPRQWRRGQPDPAWSAARS